MSEVYKKQVDDFELLVPNFKVTSVNYSLWCDKQLIIKYIIAWKLYIFLMLFFSAVFFKLLIYQLV